MSSNHDAPVVFVVELNKFGVGRVLIDGRDVSNSINAISIEAKAGEPTRITLTTLLSEVRVIGSGWMHYAALVVKPAPDFSAPGEGNSNGD